MNKYDLKTYPQLNTPIVSLLVENEVIPVDIFTRYEMSGSQHAELLFSSKVKSRKLSSYVDMIVDEYWQENDNEISLEGCLYIINVLSDKFRDKWDRLINLWNEKYNPLQPYDITLAETNGYNDTSSHSGIENSTDQLSISEDKTNENSKTSVNGFNSLSAVDSDATSTEAISTYSSSNPRSRDFENDSTVIRNGSRDYHRYGNIGNTTKQQLVEEERRVLQYQIIDVIFQDIASVICRGKYI